MAGRAWQDSSVLIELHGKGRPDSTQFHRATKENCLTLHLASLQRMCRMFFRFDHPNYARYSAFYLLNMLNLEKTHPGAEDLLKNNGFSVNRSNVPSSRNAVDITIEQTINCHAKSHSGIVGFSRNRSAYYRWWRTRLDMQEQAICKQPKR